MTMSMSFEPYNRLVKLAARCFYDDFTTKGDNMPKARSDNRGIAVIVLDALTRRQWAREEDLAKELKIHMKQLRRTLRFFEEEKLIMRDHRKESAKGAKLHNAALAATSDGQPHGKEGDDKIKMHTQSYCCLDYAQIYDVIRYRMHRMRKRLKDELESRNTIQEYICTNCKRRYNALDAARLVSMEDEYFHCEHCNSELVADSDKLISQDMGDADENARRRNQEKYKELFRKLEEQLKPLVDQLNRVKDLQVPELGTLQDWELRAATLRANGNLDGNDGSRSGQSGTPMPFLGETKVEVAFSGVQATDKDRKAADEPMKVLPPWMIRQGMNLTKEQRGEVKQESKMEEGSSSVPPDDKKSSVETDDTKDNKSVQDEFLRAYYAALYQRQVEQEEAAKKSQQETSNEQLIANNDDDSKGSSSQRQVGMKSKREDDDDLEWEDGTTAGNTSSAVNGLNGQADVPASTNGNDDDVQADVPASTNGNDDDDDVEWEDG